MRRMLGGDLERKSGNLSVRGSRIHGQGAFAERPFAQGDVILGIDDSDPVADRSKLTPQQSIFIDVFVAADGSEKTTWMKSPEKFINHSCEPNAYVLTDMRSGVRWIRAVKTVARGDEITWDYAINIWEEWIGPVSCRCGSETCRRIVQGNYFTLPREFQRRYLPLLDEPFMRRFAKEIESLHLTAEHGTA